MKRTIAAFLAILMLGSVGGVSAQAPDASPAATPASAVYLERYLLTGQQVPDGLVMIMDGPRALEDVVSGFQDPAGARDRFEDWGWQGNVVRAFHLPQGAHADRDQIDGIYMSVHQFGTSRGAAEALDYTADAHAAAGHLIDVPGLDVGDESRVLYGEMSYGDEITIYVQEGSTVIRLSVASPAGDPTEEAIALIRLVLDSAATPVSTP